ncbi:vascular cell adhesion protein 1-like [Saccostrea cucullata]|uniref:vascular cell adhesion protein 1-like n=1 Tax=Saccostrea cuccullata TaxID=36930 RepID=UPI002ED6B119
MVSLMSFVLLFVTISAIPSRRPSMSTLTSYQVPEGQNILLQCSLYLSTSDKDSFTWFWTCADEDPTLNSTSSGDTSISIMTFRAERKFNKKFCYCRATSNSSGQTYDSTSTNLLITVYYAPLTKPILNISQIIKPAGDDITLQCSIDSLGNPQIIWSWKCGTQTINSRITYIGLTSEVVFEADPYLNGKSCYCEVYTPSHYQFRASSNAAEVSVLYYPSGYPQINSRTINVQEGSPVILGCSLSYLGNPPITWSWYCNDVAMLEGIRNHDKSTELSFIAKYTKDKVICYCRGKSNHTLMPESYDQKSLDCNIKINAINIGGPSLSVLQSSSVQEGRIITLQCTVHLSSNGAYQVTWLWTCADEDLTFNSTSSGDISTMTFKAERKFNKKFCYCRATSKLSEQMYNSTSTLQSIDVYYPPLTVPTLNVSKIIIPAGDDITLQCSIDSLGNPPISWSWICGTQTIYSRVTNIGLTSEAVFVATKDLNGRSCHCEAGATSQYEFKASSSVADVSVLYNPPGYPLISTKSMNVKVGSPVLLRCTLSSAGNPSVTWSWYCNDVMVLEGVKNSETSTELSFIATLKNDTVICYCRGKSSHTLMSESYDKKSSSCYIKITGPANTMLANQFQSEGISLTVFGATLASLIVALLFCTVIIVIQHRRIPKESSLITRFFVKLGLKYDFFFPHILLSFYQDFY